MKSFVLLFTSLAYMAGCSVGKPPSDEIDAIEAITAKDSCVGALSQWHRIYAFQKRGDRIDRNMISVTYIQAGHHGLSAGRAILEPGWLTMTDDSQHRVAGGEYDRTTDRFVDWSCGCNLPPYEAGQDNECPAEGG